MLGAGSDADGADWCARELGGSEETENEAIATVGSVIKVMNDFLRLSLAAAALASVGFVDCCVSDFDLERASFGGGSTASIEKTTDFDLLAFGSTTPGEFGFDSVAGEVDSLPVALVPELAVVRDFLRRGLGGTFASFRIAVGIESAADADS